MNLEHLAKILETAQIGVANSDIYIDFMPATAKTGVLLRLPLTGVRTDWHLPNHYKTGVQAIVRAQKHATGSVIAAKVYKALTLTQKTAFANPAMIVQHLLPEHLPVVYPRSDGNGIEWSLNFRAVYWQET